MTLGLFLGLAAVVAAVAALSFMARRLWRDYQLGR
jgi:hypothetical protein